MHRKAVAPEQRRRGSTVGQGLRGQAGSRRAAAARSAPVRPPRRSHGRALGGSARRRNRCPAAPRVAFLDADHPDALALDDHHPCRLAAAFRRDAAHQVDDLERRDPASGSRGASAGAGASPSSQAKSRRSWGAMHLGTFRNEKGAGVATDAPYSLATGRFRRPGAEPPSPAR